MEASCSAVWRSESWHSELGVQRLVLCQSLEALLGGLALGGLAFGGLSRRLGRQRLGILQNLTGCSF